MCEGLSFSLKNRNIPMPYEPVAIWLIDQWRQIGLTATHEVIETTAYQADLRAGNFEVAARLPVRLPRSSRTSSSTSSSPTSISRHNYGRYIDTMLDDLYHKQARAARRRRAQEMRPRSSSSACSTRRPTVPDARSGTASSRTRKGAGLEDHAEPLREQAARPSG